MVFWIVGCIDLLPNHPEEGQFETALKFGIPSKILGRSGLINKKENKNFVVPDWFDPFVYKNIDIPIGCLNLKKKDKNKFRIFKGDGDQDRPN